MARQSKNNETIALTAEQLKEKWAAEKAGVEWNDPRPAIIAQRQITTVIEQKEKIARGEIEDPLVVARRQKEMLAKRVDKKSLENDKLRQALENAKWSPDTLRKKLDDILKSLNVEPAHELIKIATEVHPAGTEVAGVDISGTFVNDVDLRTKIWMELMAYRMPKLKAMEISGQVDQSLTVMIQKQGGEQKVIAHSATRVMECESEVVQSERTSSGSN